MHLKRLLLFLVLSALLAWPCRVIAAEARSADLTLLPSGPLFAPPLADPMTPVLSLKYMATTNHETHIGKVSAGTTFGLLRLDAGPTALQLNIAGGIFSRFDLYDLFGGETTDFLIGFPIDLIPRSGTNGWAFQLTPYHTSSHLLDETIFKNADSTPPIEPAEYSRDVIRLLIAYRFSPLDRLYAGAAFAFDGIDWRYLHNYQAGSEFFSPARTFFHREFRLYLADDLQVKEETNWSLNLNLQAGVSIKRPDESHGLRIAVEYFDGNAVEGQFFEQKEQNIGLAAFFDLYSGRHAVFSGWKELISSHNSPAAE